MFEDAVFATAREELAEEIVASPTTPMDPLPADRWICRSALQKAVRRGEVALALRASATLLLHDRRSLWRALICVALEDVGYADLDLIVKVVAAASYRPWRMRQGGEWTVIAELLRQCCGGRRCQAVCDLLLAASFDPHLAAARDSATSASSDTLADQAFSDDTLGERAVALLALSGGLPSSDPPDADRLFHVIEAQAPGHVATVASVAWRLSRSPLAVLLPLLWEPYQAESPRHAADDAVPDTVWLSDVPSFAIDQYTRAGLTAFRRAIGHDGELADFLASTGEERTHWARLMGDIVFLAEGGVARKRLLWSTAERLRQPFRHMPVTSRVPAHVGQGIDLIRRKASLIDDCRQASHPSS